MTLVNLSYFKHLQENKDLQKDSVTKDVVDYNGRLVVVEKKYSYERSTFERAFNILVFSIIFLNPLTIFLAYRNRDLLREREVILLKGEFQEEFSKTSFSIYRYVKNLFFENASQVKDFRGVDFRGMDLQGVDLQGADLRGANLQGAKLQGAKLQGAKLQGANLQGAKLQGAAFQASNLIGTDFRGVEFDEDTKFDRATIVRMRISNIEFRCKNIESAKIDKPKEEPLVWMDFTCMNYVGAEHDAILVLGDTSINESVKNDLLQMYPHLECYYIKTI